ncbi:MAG: lipopolysaccharide heptosyltransferase II [wastewater metagenome]|nr:lipopolysaccharide heptosyltransferase II [Candidatus Loosdrechtia aerotolerans]
MIANNNWNGAKNVLCVRLDNVGDVLMTTPAIRALKDSYPGRRITLLASSSSAKLFKLVPEIDDIIVYDAPWIKSTALRSNSKSEYTMVKCLKQGKFDAAVIFTVYSQNPLPAAFLCYLADIPLRLAYCHENPYQLLTDWLPDKEPGLYIRHEVQRQLDLVASIGCYTTDERISLFVPCKTRERVLNILDKAKVDRKRPWIVMHAGASAPSRRYPPESFASVARYLAKDMGYQIILTGVESELALIYTIQAMIGVPSYSLAGRLNFGELAALLSFAPLLISNNTAPVHVASAFGTRVVDIYALTNPQHIPWKVPSRVLFHDVPCKYCYKSICPEGHHNCLRLVSPAAVINAAYELLNEGVNRTWEGLL